MPAAGAASGAAAHHVAERYAAEQAAQAYAHGVPRAAEYGSLAAHERFDAATGASVKLYGQQPAEDGGKWGGSVLAQSAYYSERGENAHLAVPTISAASAAAAAEFPLEGRKHAQKPVVSLGQRAGEAPPPALTAFAEQRARARRTRTLSRRRPPRRRRRRRSTTSTR